MARQGKLLEKKYPGSKPGGKQRPEPYQTAPVFFMSCGMGKVCFFLFQPFSFFIRMSLTAWGLALPLLAFMI